MKILFPKIVVLIFLLSPGICPQSIEGFWKTSLIIPGDTLTLYLEIKLSAGTSDVRLTVPEQMLFDYKAAKVYSSSDSLSFGFTDLMADIYGKPKLTNDTLYLVFNQGMFKQLIRLTAADTPFFKVRPQRPVPPFPYSSENVKVENKSAAIHLAGTLTIPHGKSKPPAVILVSGSGAQNRDMDIMGHSYFYVLAHFLSGNGIAVLRCDDRGTAESEGDFEKATTADFASDVSAQTDFLINHPAGFDKDKIGVIGISEGGMIAPLAALQNIGIQFIILLSAPGVTGGEIITSQSHIINTLMGEEPVKVATIDCITAGVIEHIQKTESDPSLPKSIGRIYDDCLEISELTDKKKFRTDPKTNRKVFTGTFSSVWMQYFIRLNPENYLPKLKIPMLAINGTLDLQVPVSVNQKKLEELIKMAGNPKNETVVFEGLNHLLQKAEKGLISEYPEISTTIEQNVLDKILEWIGKL